MALPILAFWRNILALSFLLFWPTSFDPTDQTQICQLSNQCVQLGAVPFFSIVSEIIIQIGGLELSTEISQVNKNYPEEFSKVF